MNYRLYRLNLAGLIAGPPEEFDAVGDTAAIARMQAAADKDQGVYGYELWERSRRVAVLAAKRRG